MPTPRGTIDHTGCTPLQRRFAWLYTRGPIGIAGSAAAAYVEAKEAGAWLTISLDDKTRLRNTANATLRFEHVAALVARYRMEDGAEHDLDRYGYLGQTKKLLEECLIRGDLKAARAVNRDMGEVLGHYVQRIAVTHASSPEEAEMRLLAILERRPDLVARVMDRMPADMARRMALPAPQIVLAEEKKEKI